MIRSRMGAASGAGGHVDTQTACLKDINIACSTPGVDQNVALRQINRLEPFQQSGRSAVICRQSGDHIKQPLDATAAEDIAQQILLAKLTRSVERWPDANRSAAFARVRAFANRQTPSRNRRQRGDHLRQVN